MKLCVAGQNQIAVEGVRFITHKFPDAKVYVIPNKRDDGNDSWQPSLRKAAATFGCQLSDLEKIAKENIDLFFSLECDTIINISEIACDKLFNIHFSLLPYYKGVYTSAWPILNGDSESGVTLHVIDERVDGGPIIDQISFKLEYNETALTLYDKYQAYGVILLMNNIDSIVSNNFHAIPQINGGSYYNKSSINYRDLKLDLNVDAENLSRQIRAYYFPSFQIPEIDGIRIMSPMITDVVSINPPGSIQFINEKQVAISTKSYDVLCSVVT